MIASEFRNYQLAADLIAQAISINPDNADAYFNRGNALKELNRLDAAVASYEKAIKLKPNYASACNNRGITLHKLNRFDAAVSSYDKAVRIDPNYAERISTGASRCRNSTNSTRRSPVITARRR